jgi:hypothetical protein
MWRLSVHLVVLWDAIHKLAISNITHFPHRSLSMFKRFEVFTAVTMKNVDFWDIKIQFVLHRGHITFPLQIIAG